MQTNPARHGLASRLAVHDTSGLLYGAIVTAAVLVSVGGLSDTVGQVVATWAFVLSIYWLTHVYVHAAEGQFQGDDRHLLHRSLTAAKAEVAVLAGGIPAIAVFVVLATTDTELIDAARSALFFTVMLLAVFGYVGARHAGRSTAAAWGEAFGASLLGILMALGKTLLH